MAHMLPFQGSLYAPTAMKRHGLPSAYHPSVKSVQFNVPESNSGRKEGESTPVDVDVDVSAHSHFKVKPDFLKVIRQVQGVSQSQTIFTYDELARYLATYILSRKNKFFDPRNIKVAIVAGDDLGKAFHLSAFHRSQVTTFLKRQLITLESSVKHEIKSEPRTPSPSSPAHMRTSTSNIKTEIEVKHESPFMQLQSSENYQDGQKQLNENDPSENGAGFPKWTTTEHNYEPLEERSTASQKLTPNVSNMQTNQVSICNEAASGSSSVRVSTNLFATTNHKVTHSSSASSSQLQSSVEETENTSRKHKPKALTHSNELTVNEKEKANDMNSDSESRHSKRGPNPPGCSNNDSSSPSEEPSSTSPRRKRRRQSSFSYAVLGYSSDDKETVYSAQGYETAEVHSDYEYEEDGDEEIENNETLTEYEVDSEADREDEEALGSHLSESCDDSIIEDVVVRRGEVGQFDTSKDSDNWADSESDFELCNFDPELGPRSSEVWKCVRCSEPNPPLIRYCNRCWKERRGWLPDPPRRWRSRRHRNKQTLGQNVKGITRSSTTSLSSTSTVRRSLTSMELVSSQEMATTSSVAEDDHSLGDVAQDDLSFSKSNCDSQTAAKSTTSSSSSSGSIKSGRDVCDFCLSRPKNAGLIHGRIIHQVCCYPCAKKLFKKRATCPLCRRKIEKIAEIIKS